MSEQSVFSNSADPGLSGGNSSGEPPQARGSVGQQLRAAREARSLTLADAAQSLKLAPRQVAALESEDWSSLPGNTMIRGFVRNYARVLNLDPDALMRGLDATQMQRTLQLDASAGTSSSLPQASNQAERRDYVAVIGGLLLLVLALLAYFYVPQDFWREQLATLTGSETSPATVESPAVVALPVAAATEGSANAPQQPAVTAASAALPTAVAAPDGKALTAPDVKADTTAAGKSEAKPTDTLKLRFAQAAWVEVRDGRGEVVAFGVKPADSQQEIKGQPPFSLVLGNAKYVQVEYQGKAIDLEPHISKGVARLSVK